MAPLPTFIIHLPMGEGACHVVDMGAVHAVLMAHNAEAMQIMQLGLVTQVATGM
jgi:hypothetical protein